MELWAACDAIFCRLNLRVATQTLGSFLQSGHTQSCRSKDYGAAVQKRIIGVVKLEYAQLTFQRAFDMHSAYWSTMRMR